MALALDVATAVVVEVVAFQAADAVAPVVAYEQVKSKNALRTPGKLEVDAFQQFFVYLPRLAFC